jgi:hypothetical protein
MHTLLEAPCIGWLRARQDHRREDSAHTLHAHAHNLVLSTVNHLLNFISSGKRMDWCGEGEGVAREFRRGERRGERKASSRNREAGGGVNTEGQHRKRPQEALVKPQPFPPVFCHRERARDSLRSGRRDRSGNGRARHVLQNRPCTSRSSAVVTTCLAPPPFFSYYFSYRLPLGLSFLQQQERTREGRDGGG